MDPYIQDVMESRKLLIVERAVDEDLQADEELKTAYETVADRFVDGEISREDLDQCPFGEEEINLAIDDAISSEGEDNLVFSEPTTYADNDGELAEINAALDSDIDPEILELDDDDIYAE